MDGMFAPFAWLALAICWLAAAISFLESRRRRRLLDVQSGLDSIAAMSWREFELLVGEAFRRQGYSVEETGLGGADGGIDLIIRREGRTELVQCKQWQARQVNVSVVREMWGLVAHHGAAGARIVCTGTFTADAAAFAAGKPIELITGERLLAYVRAAQGSAGPSPLPVTDEIPRSRAFPDRAVAPACPKCGANMVARINKKTRQGFWGCATYPRCHGTLPG